MPRLLRLPPRPAAPATSRFCSALPVSGKRPKGPAPAPRATDVDTYAEPHLGQGLTAAPGVQLSGSPGRIGPKATSWSLGLHKCRATNRFTCFALASPVTGCSTVLQLLVFLKAVDIQPACLGLYCGRTAQYINATTHIYGDCGVCPRGQRTDGDKICRKCTGSPGHYDWLYLGFMAMLPLVLHWFFIEWYSGKKSSSALFQHLTALFECSIAAIVTLLVSDPVGFLYIHSCKVMMLSDWYTMLYNPSPDYITTVHCTHEAVYPLYTIVFIYYAFCLVLMMLLRPLLVKKIACGLGKSDRFKSIYAALYFFPILTVLQAVGGGLLYYAFPYIILVLSLVTLAVYMSASEVESFKDLLVRKKRLVILSSHWLLHAYGIISISKLERLGQDLPLLALVPAPALFYLLTAKYTEPSRILSEGANGH